jgi:hypothetical protein
MNHSFHAAAFAVLAAAAGCQPRTPPVRDESVIVLRQSLKVLDALKAKDMRLLATLVHPEDGLRFSPWAYVHADSERVFSRTEVARLWTDTTRYTWGSEDGTGNPIHLSFAQYYARFVFDHDFTQAPQRTYTSAPIRHGNTPSNLADVYPDAAWVEFHFPGFEARYEGMDWASLWLVFRRHREEWLLVGIVHGSWTI